MTNRKIILDVDNRGRASIGKLFPDVSQLVATETQGGWLFQPAVVFPSVVPKILANPELVRELNEALDPRNSVTLRRRTSRPPTSGPSGQQLDSGSTRRDSVRQQEEK